MIGTFQFCDRNSSLHGRKYNYSIKDARMVCQTNDTIIVCGELCRLAKYYRKNGYIRVIALSVFSLLGYKFFAIISYDIIE